MSLYARVKDGVITNVYDSVPNSLDNTISGFDKLSPAERKFYGFYEIIQSEKQLTYNPQEHTITVSENNYDSETDQVSHIFDYTNTFTEQQLLAIKIENFYRQMREYRNELIRQTDWMVLPDAFQKFSEEQQQKILSYRQNLRDITDNLTYEEYGPQFSEQFIEKLVL